MHAGANRVLSKPIQLDNLLTTIAELSDLKLVFEEAEVALEKSDEDYNLAIFEGLPEDTRQRVISALRVGKIAELRQLVILLKEWDETKGKVFESMVKRYDLKGLKRHFF